MKERSKKCSTDQRFIKRNNFLKNPYSKITGDLLVAANKYDVSDLVNYCVKFLGDNLSEKNVAGVMTSAFLADQEELFQSAYKFLFKLKIENVEIKAWKNLDEKNPTLAAKMMRKAMLNHEPPKIFSGLWLNDE